MLKLDAAVHDVHFGVSGLRDGLIFSRKKWWKSWESSCRKIL